MRYMGDVASEVLFQVNGAALDPNVKATLLGQASVMPDPRARDLLDLSDATPYGARMKYIRFGLGAAVGVLVGVALGRAKKKR